MRCSTSLLLIGLTVITLSQWFAINILLIHRDNNTILNSSSADGLASSSSLVVGKGELYSTSPTDHLVDETKTQVGDVFSTDDIEDEQQRAKKKEQEGIMQYEGVATTLMINAPWWFQKRYSTMMSNIVINTPGKSNSNFKSFHPFPFTTNYTICFYYLFFLLKIANWAIQIFYIADESSQSHFGLEVNPNLARLNATYDRIIFTPLPEDLISKFGHRKKLLYWTNSWIWENLVADRVLVFNGNGVICSNGLLSLLDGSALTQLFQHVDYIGSPWKSHYGEGGDGSFSFRNRNAMLDAIKYKPYDLKKDSREDYYFLRNLKEINNRENDGGGGGGDKITYRIATKEQTHLFAGNLESFDNERGPPSLPMVVSGTMASLDHKVRQNILNACPELGMLFPMLHHPSCFGAHPDGEECGKHICALTPSSERKSGC